MTRGQAILAAALAAGVGFWLYRRSLGPDAVFYGPGGSYGVVDLTDAGGVWTTAAPVERAGNAPRPPASTVGPQAPGVGSVLARSGTGAAAGVGAAALGPGSVLAGLATAGIATAAAVLTWAITYKGLFRGGEEGIIVNPMRDDYLSFYGPGGTGPESGFGRLAAALTEITGEPNGSHYFKALIEAHKKETLVQATRDIQDVFGRVGITVPAY